MSPRLLYTFRNLFFPVRRSGWEAVNQWHIPRFWLKRKYTIYKIWLEVLLPQGWNLQKHHEVMASFFSAVRKFDHSNLQVGKTHHNLSTWGPYWSHTARLRLKVHIVEVTYKCRPAQRVSINHLGVQLIGFDYQTARGEKDVLHQQAVGGFESIRIGPADFSWFSWCLKKIGERVDVVNIPWLEQLLKYTNTDIDVPYGWTFSHICWIYPPVTATIRSITLALLSRESRYINLNLPLASWMGGVDPGHILGMSSFPITSPNCRHKELVVLGAATWRGVATIDPTNLPKCLGSWCSYVTLVPCLLVTCLQGYDMWYVRYNMIQLYTYIEILCVT